MEKENGKRTVDHEKSLRWRGLEREFRIINCDNSSHMYRLEIGIFQ